MCKGRQKKQHTPARQTTATIDTHRARGGDLVGTLFVPQSDMQYFNSSRTNMTFACLRKRLIECKEQIEPNTITERLKQNY